MGGVKSKCLLLDKSNKGSEFNLGQGYFMKTLKKIGFAVFAICMAFATMSCKDDDDDSPAVVTEWVSEENGTITCYDDKTFSVKLEGVVAMTGTYSGDTTKSDVEIVIKVEKIMELMLSDSESTKLVSFEKIGTGKISKDGKTMKVTIPDLGGGTFTKK